MCWLFLMEGVSFFHHPDFIYVSILLHLFQIFFKRQINHLESINNACPFLFLNLRRSHYPEVIFPLIPSTLYYILLYFVLTKQIVSLCVWNSYKTPTPWVPWGGCLVSGLLLFLDFGLFFGFVMSSTFADFGL